MTDTFPRTRRLRKRWQYLEVQNNGHKVVSRYFIGLFVASSPGDESRIGITATKRYGNAVMRNRLRRLVREAFRRGILNLPQGVDLVVIPKKHVIGQSSDRVFSDLELLGRKVAVLLETGK